MNICLKTSLSCLCLFEICLFFACSFEPLVETNVQEAAEAAVKPVLSPEDIACTKDYECMVADLGCCRGDEPVAINKKRVFALKRSVVKFCSPLLLNPDLCKGKKYNFFPPKTECRELKCAVMK